MHALCLQLRSWLAHLVGAYQEENGVFLCVCACCLVHCFLFSFFFFYSFWFCYCIYFIFQSTFVVVVAFLFSILLFCVACLFNDREQNPGQFYGEPDVTLYGHIGLPNIESICDYAYRFTHISKIASQCPTKVIRQ